MILTEEQQAIVATDINKGQILKIIAKAGAAKTTTLNEYARARPDESFLYIAFNKAVQLEAELKFPTNVVCKTTHALAYGKFGKKYKHKLKFDVKPYMLTRPLNISKYAIGNYVIGCLKKFLCSADPVPALEHMVLEKDKSIDEYFLDKMDGELDYLLSKVTELWTKMCSEDEEEIPMVHDGYLKLYQLSQPKLKYDAILLDEAHDTASVVMDIFSRQKCKKILVLDKNQAIYGWRGASDQAIRLTADKEMRLSTSFRFGPNIAETANIILETFVDEKHKVVGNRPVDKIGNIDKTNPYCVISRTNAALFDEAVTALRDSPGKKFGFLGTSPNNDFSPYSYYGFDKIVDMYYLKSGDKGKIKDDYIKKFKSFDAMLQVIEDEKAPDMELKARAKVVKKYDENVKNLVDKIVANSIDPSKAQIVFSTAHRAKGMEFPQVKLCEDFGQLVIAEGDHEPKLAKIGDDIDEQEINLLYVAATRAKETLQINESIRALVEFVKNS